MRGSSLARPFWVALGLLAVACGAVGAVLPLVPTTPFLLLAAFAFARSSPRLHHWLTTHKQFGPLIDNWNRHRAIGRRTKLVSVSVMAVMPLASWGLGVPLWIVGVQVGVLACVGLFIVTRRSPPQE